MRHSQPQAQPNIGQIVPLLLPAHVQVQGPVPEMDDAVPVVHKLVVGALVVLAPLDEPHAPFAATAFATLRLNFIVDEVPPAWPEELKRR